jgi:hypothetical protein
MFYRPHFCCHCGEKIIRTKWTALTSRRFCEFCAIEQKQHDLIPRAAAIAILLFGAAGLTAFLGGGGATSNDRAASAKVRSSKADQSQTAANTKATNGSRLNTSPQTVGPTEDPRVSNSNAGNSVQRAPQRNSSTETVYYCGAMTKKGTPCTRRVKSPGRCWQHLGQPAASSTRN